MNQFFVTGTDTGVGKTLASAILVRLLQAHYWKPVQSGIIDELPDALQVQRLANCSAERIVPSCYMLNASLSPHEAAALENVKISLSNCTLPAITTPLIVEGAGGILVPLNQQATILDLIKQLQLPVIIVARGTLGTINHTMLTIAVLRQHHIPIYGIIYSGQLNPHNQRTIEALGGVRTLFHIPLFKEITASAIQAWLLQQSDIRACFSCMG